MQRSRSEAPSRHVRPAISPTPLPLVDSLAIAHAMGQRPDLDGAQRLTPAEWKAAASAALLRRDRAGLETLVRVELAPAIAKAIALLGATVKDCTWWPEEISDQWVRKIVVRLDGACLALLHATEVVRVTERWEALGDPERAAPTRPKRGTAVGVLEQASIYQQKEWGDAHEAVSRDLGDALCSLASAAEAVVRLVDAGQLEELPTSPLQEQLYRAHAVAAAVLAYELALLGEGPLADPATPLILPE
ncbi:hypothetical protein [Paraliomyxa miuraensis]|uniref:hypothetical protein n=1 Tax=Paraliomyxa miuraensis TaxID=376150 RepID=UPI0022566CD1|nr:hypothetical protein [Paraliomyxa miuraensis]MCX4244183.1 hypothetical protein [Paraliomyxa miuraensis]